jgi:glutamate formiminotransferase
MLECVPNVSEGRDRVRLEHLADACGDALLDLHVDADHNRSVFTLAGAPDNTEAAARRLAQAVAEHIDIGRHVGVHPRIGALDVVPFVALGDHARGSAFDAALAFAEWASTTLAIPVFLYGDADPHARSLPDIRRAAFVDRAPDLGPAVPHPRLGAVAVGVRPVLVAVNCVLATDDLALARVIATKIRERDGGLPGVRALGLRLASVARVQVSMNLIALERTGVQRACEAVRTHALAAGSDAIGVELVGLLPAAELARCDPSFRAWARIGPGQTIEARLRARPDTGLDLS